MSLKSLLNIMPKHKEEIGKAELLIACPFCKCIKPYLIFDEQYYLGFCPGCKTRGPSSRTATIAASLWNRNYEYNNTKDNSNGKD